MLARHGIAGTFYVPQDAPLGTMSPAQLRALATGFEIGAHTLEHERLTRLAPSRSWQEISGSKRWVEDQTGRECRMFCPPGGRFSNAHLGMAQRAGFLGLRSVELVSLAMPREVSGILVMPTTVQACDHGSLDYLKNFAKRAAVQNLWRYVRYGLPGGWQSLARRLLEHILPDGGVFHLWGHSWELAGQGQWQRLEEVLRFMASHQDDTGRTLTNGQVCELAKKQPQPSSFGAEAGYEHAYRRCP